MHQLRQRLLKCSALLVFAVAANAQDLRVVATISQPTIGTEESVTYSLEIQGNPLPNLATPEPPATEGLVLNNRFPTTSRNISVVNGAMTQSLAFSWSFSPVKEGTARFKPTAVVIDGKRYTTDAITVQIVPQASRPQRPPRSTSLFDQIFTPPGTSAEPSGPTEISSDDIFIRAVPSKRTAFQNEQVTVEYGLYFRSGIQLRQSRLADSWDAEGFWREELEVENRPIPQQVVENGVRYNKIILKRVAVFPTRTGSLKIDPLRIESEASLPTNGRDAFFSLRNRYQPVQLASPTVRIEARALPDNAPVGFDGAVGSYSIAANLSRTALEVGESTTLRVTISGSGNLATLEGPNPPVPNIFEVYEPQVSTTVNRSGDSVRGSKTFEYVLVPRTNGTFTVPPIEFSFLDTRRGAYRTVSSKAMEVSVTGVAPVTAAATATADGFPIDDISGIIQNVGTIRSSGKAAPHRSVVVYSVLLLPLIVLSGAWIYQRHATRLSSDATFARNRRAHPLARKHLKKAAEFLDDGAPKEYYAELERAVTGFAGNRLNIGERALVREEWVGVLNAAGADDETTRDMVALLQECDRVRFAPIPPDNAAMNTALERASKIITDLDQQIGNGSK